MVSGLTVRCQKRQINHLFCPGFVRLVLTQSNEQITGSGPYWYRFRSLKIESTSRMILGLVKNVSKKPNGKLNKLADLEVSLVEDSDLVLA